MNKEETLHGDEPLSAVVDSEGVLRGSSRFAERLLAQRAGRYTFLPSPRCLLWFAPSNGEGSKSSRVVRLAGQIATPGAMCDVVAQIAQLGWRGELFVCSHSQERSLYFDQGQVCGAGTTAESERLGAVMYRYGVITESQRAAIATACAEGGRFGQQAVELGLVSQQGVYDCLRHQVEDIVFASLEMDQGTFCFMDGFDETRLVSHQRVSAHQLLMDGVTRTDEIKFFRQKVPSTHHIPAQRSAPDVPPDELMATFQAVDGRRSVGELGRVTGRGEFAATKDIYGLLRSGHVVLGLPARADGVAEFVASANRVLRAAFVAVGPEQSEHLRESLAAFAGGAGVYDPLFAQCGPALDGSLDELQLQKNSCRLKTEQPAELVQKMLYDYVSFAIFCVGAAVGWQREAALSDAMQGSLHLLRPAEAPR